MSSLSSRVHWNKGKLTGQKPPLKLAEIWAIRTRLQVAASISDLALFNLAIDSKLRAARRVIERGHPVIEVAARLGNQHGVVSLDQ
ncbi:hypothetical protein [Cupriavidus taiwanensis]|uniref:hypothetical protein n=1 Tax=Cupriavidus taiwanensis TaxID=164546 RepID=UPI00358E9974